MSVKLASLFLGLSADGAELTTELKKASRNVKKWGDGIDRIGARAAKVFGTAAAGVIGLNTALAASFNNQRQYIVTLDSTSRKLGDLGANIQAARFAADQQDIAIGSLDTGLQRLVRRLSEAANGSGEARGAIEELGLDANRLASLLPTQALAEVLGALEGVENQSDRVRLAFKFFDTEGVDFVRLTGSAIEDARKELDDMGASLSQLDIAQVVAANDQMGRFSEAINAVQRRVAVRLAPAVGEFANQLFESAKQGQQLEQVLDSAITLGLTGAANLLEFAGRAINFVSNNADVVEYGAIGYILLGKKGAALGAVLGGIKGAAEDLYGRIANRLSSNPLDRIQQEIRDLQAQIDTVQPLAEKFPEDDFIARRLSTLNALLAESKIRFDEAGGDGEAALKRVEDQASTTSQAMNIVGDGALKLSANLKLLLKNQDFSAFPPPELGAPTAANTNFGNEAGEEEETDKRLEASRQKLRDFYAEEERQLAEADKKRRLHASSTLKIVGDTQARWTQFAEAGSAGRFSILAEELGGSLSAAAQHSRKAFELNKVVGYANAVISGGQAAANALATQPFFPVGLAMLGVAVTKTATILSGIKRQQFAASGSAIGGGSGSTAVATSSVASGSGSSTPAVDDTDAANDSGRQVVNLTVIATPGMSQDEIDQQQAIALQRNIDAGRIDADAEIRTNVVFQGAAA